MKALFVIKSTYNFSYVSSIAEALERRGWTIQLLFDGEWSRGVPDLALRTFLSESPDTDAYWLLRRSQMRGLVFWLREIRSYVSYTLRKDQSKFYEERWRAYAGVSSGLRWLLANRVVYWLLSQAEKLIPADRYVKSDIIDRAPDVVIASPANHRFSEEIEYIKAAKSLGIPTFVPVLSWDNLTTKGVFHVLPDLLLVWNEAQKEEALRIHGAGDVAIIGAPFFDKWSMVENESRESFCRRFGLDPDKKFCLYLGSSRNIAKDETEHILKIKKGLADAGIELLVRPHPANYCQYERMDANVMPSELPEEYQSKKDFHNAIRHCLYAMGINTSAMIDAFIHDKPCISVEPQTQTVHFRHMKLALGFFGNRQRFVKQYIFPKGSAGQAAADVIINETRRKATGKK